ncbi:MAG: SH3 domain-containing protein [Chloroflexota bacterium]
MSFSLADIIQISVFLLAALLLIFAFRALLIGLRSIRAERKERFNVGRLEEKRRLFRSVFTTMGLVVMAVIILVVGLTLPAERVADQAQGAFPAIFGAPESPLPITLNLEGVNLDEPPEIQVLAEDGTVLQPAEEIPDIPTETPALPPTEPPAPTPTPSPTPQIVFVNSPVVGLYMRDNPGGEIVVLLEDQTPLVIQGEPVVQDEIEWVEISTFDGSRGWVSRAFLTDVTPPTPEPDSSEDDITTDA